MPHDRASICYGAQRARGGDAAMTLPICQHITMIEVVRCEECEELIQIDLRDFKDLTKITTKDCDFYLMPCPHCAEIVAVNVKKAGAP